MGDNAIVPCLWFDDQAEEAAEFYASVFPGSRITFASRYPESTENPSGKPPGSVLTVEFEIGGQPFTALNGGPQFKMNQTISFFVHVPTPEEADRIFGQLADGGRVMMPIDRYPWSDRYGWVQDKYGASWQIMLAPDDPARGRPVPCLMFANDVGGRAGEAAELYTKVFGGSVTLIDRYAADEGPEGAVKHGRLSLGAQDLIVMDSHIPHEAAFNEGISLQVMCRDQAEVDHYWATLSEGGEKGPCGWLKDRFGVSWQIVPQGFVEMMRSGDRVARDRAFAAVMEMGKLDLAAIRAAFEGQDSKT